MTWGVVPNTQNSVTPQFLTHHFIILSTKILLSLLVHPDVTCYLAL